MLELNEMALETELKTYERELPHLLKHKDKFALIEGDTVVDTFDTYEDALKMGYKLFGRAPFMVKHIEPNSHVHLVTRLIVPCLA